MHQGCLCQHNPKSRANANMPVAAVPSRPVAARRYLHPCSGGCACSTAGPREAARACSRWREPAAACACAAPRRGCGSNAGPPRRRRRHEPGCTVDPTSSSPAEAARRRELQHRTPRPARSPRARRRDPDAKHRRRRGRAGRPRVHLFSAWLSKFSNPTSGHRSLDAKASKA